MKPLVHSVSPALARNAPNAKRYCVSGFALVPVWGVYEIEARDETEACRKAADQFLQERMAARVHGAAESLRTPFAVSALIEVSDRGALSVREIPDRFSERVCILGER